MMQPVLAAPRLAFRASSLERSMPSDSGVREVSHWADGKTQPLDWAWQRGAKKPTEASAKAQYSNVGPGFNSSGGEGAGRACRCLTIRPWPAPARQLLTGDQRRQ